MLKGKDRKTILVVDDMAENIDVVKTLLATEYTVKAAISGKIALKIAETYVPDLILLDVMMPEMDGYEVYKRLKNNGKTADIPIIFLTAMDRVEDEAYGLELGAVDYIAKPINPSVLMARINTRLALADARKELADQKREIEELYKQLNTEISTAIEIHQRNFMAKIPSFPEVSLAAHYQPAKRLGGDFYNFTETEDKLILYLSDVTGHGLEGIVFNAFVKEAIDSYLTLRPAEINPQSILHHVDRQYRRDNYPEDYFVCIFLAVLDMKTFEMSYSGAGFHTPPLLYQGTGEQLILTCLGPPISNAINQELMDFSVSYVQLMPKSTLLMTTDGLIEQFNGQIEYQDRLKDVFYANCHLPPELILRAINDDFKKFNHGSLEGDDDITYIILQIH